MDQNANKDNSTGTTKYRRKRKTQRKLKRTIKNDNQIKKTQKQSKPRNTYL